MKKRTQKIIALVLIAMLGFAGCAEQHGEAGTTTATTTQPDNIEEIACTTAQNETTESIEADTTPAVTETPTEAPTEMPTSTETPTETTQETIQETTVEPHTHEYVDTVTKEATCTAAGELTHTCEICGDAYTEEIKKNDHKYKETVVKPTCTEKGYTDYICECGDSYVGNPVDVLGHSFTNYVYNNDATIEKDGTKTAKCNNSNCTFTDTVTAPGTQKPLTFDGTENHYRWATSKVTVRDFPSSNGNVIGTVNVNDSVYIVDRCIETDYFKIKYGDGYGYVKNNMDLTLTDPNAPEPEPEPTPEPEPEKKYDGYDEFGNGYRWGQRGGKTVKLFDVDCPYDITKVYEESSTVLYVYGLQGMPGKLLDANAMLEERYGVYSIIENESIVLGHYNGKKVTINYARYLGQYNH